MRRDPYPVTAIEAALSEDVRKLLSLLVWNDGPERYVGKEFKDKHTAKPWRTSWAGRVPEYYATRDEAVEATLRFAGIDVPVLAEGANR